MNSKLIDLREAKDISRTELSRILEISRSMIEKVERGTRRASPDLAKKWGLLLGLKESQLYHYFFANKPDNMCKTSSDPNSAA